MANEQNHFSLSLLLILGVVGCSGGSSGSIPPSPQLQNGAEDLPHEPTVPGVPPAGPKSGGLSICSKLDFNDVQWPAEVDLQERDPLALALNISGSFEGPDGWENLTNNFDGQGLSLGLLNQCLGQGSLQPMLVKMRDQYNDEMAAQFSSANLNSLLSMLKQWQAAINTTNIDLSEYGLSKLDNPQLVEETTGFNPDAELHAELSTKNQNSVNWAIANLYNNSTFKPDWQKQLISLSASAGYRSIQIDAAVSIHMSTMTLFKTFALKQFRSYLFLFDIVVQNGGIPAAGMTNIMAAFKANPHWTEIQKLNEILAERLKYVKKQYVTDVRLRKQSIITGTGTVHSVHRDYAKEYCANLNQSVP